MFGSLPDSWETLVVTLGTARTEGKQLSLARVKSSLLDEEARRRDKDTSSDSKAFLTESERGRQRNRSPQNQEKSGTRSKSRGRPTCFYCGKPGHFQKNCRHFRKDKETDDTDSKRSMDRNGKDRVRGREAITQKRREGEGEIDRDKRQ